jgi:hypothetical protein
MFQLTKRILPAVKREVQILAGHASSPVCPHDRRQHRHRVTEGAGRGLRRRLWLAGGLRSPQPRAHRRRYGGGGGGGGGGYRGVGSPLAQRICRSHSKLLC